VPPCKIFAPSSRRFHSISEGDPMLGKTLKITVLAALFTLLAAA
jgi:hypothetical protein